MSNAKATALAHQRRVREIFTPMMATFGTVVERRWPRHAVAARCILDMAAHSVRVLPNPSRLYRESGLPPADVGAALDYACVQSYPAHGINLPKRDAPKTQFVRDRMSEDLRGLEGAIQRANSESIELLRGWLRLAEFNAGYLLTGELKSPVFEPLERFMKNRIGFGRWMAIRRQDPVPHGSGPPFDFTQVGGGAYGDQFAAKLLMTAAILADWARDLVEESKRIARDHAAVIGLTARGMDKRKPLDLAALRVFREGILSLLASVGILTAERQERFADPVDLVEAAMAAGIPTTIATKFPGGALGPLALTGASLPGLLVDAGSTLHLEPQALGELHAMQVATRNPWYPDDAPASGYGCPAGTLIDDLAQHFLRVLKLVDVELDGHGMTTPDDLEWLRGWIVNLISKGDVAGGGTATGESV